MAAEEDLRFGSPIDVDEIAEAVAARVVDRLGRPPQLLSLKETAAMLGLGERSVRDLSDRGVLPSLLVGVERGARRYELAEVEKYIERERKAAAA